MKLRELIDNGVFSLDDEVHWQWSSDDGEPDIREPDEYADDEGLAVGAEFELHEGLYLTRPRRYRVVAAPDPETGDGQYRVERIKAGSGGQS